jgi:hypothetical protein
MALLPAIEESGTKRSSPPIAKISNASVAHLLVVPAGVQTVEMGNAIKGEQHRLAIDETAWAGSCRHERLFDGGLTCSPISLQS